jgi:hypothetical protein
MEECQTAKARYVVKSWHDYDRRFDSVSEAGFWDPKTTANATENRAWYLLGVILNIDRGEAQFLLFSDLALKVAQWAFRGFVVGRIVEFEKFAVEVLLKPTPKLR